MCAPATHTHATHLSTPAFVRYSSVTSFPKVCVSASYACFVPISLRYFYSKPLDLMYNKQRN